MNGRLEEAWREYAQGVAAHDSARRDDLLLAATDHPAATWEWLAPRFAEPVPDQLLACVTIEVLRLLHIYGTPELRTDIRHAAGTMPNLDRALRAFDRYNRKYEELDSLLRGEEPARIATGDDLLLPNPFDDDCFHEHDTEAAVTLSQRERTAFLDHDQDVLETVQYLIEVSPQRAWESRSICCARRAMTPTSSGSASGSARVSLPITNAS